ncbi:hypothetical protein OF83DRAFT_1142918 [Amylostereum chailletii]|nr:hypothetical protein OF83DRAFT_1142918 [Amylostereum chailletii]
MRECARLSWGFVFFVWVLLGFLLLLFPAGCAHVVLASPCFLPMLYFGNRHHARSLSHTCSFVVVAFLVHWHALSWDSARFLYIP